MKNGIIRLHDEVGMMKKLMQDSITLTRFTNITKPMKKLIEIHDLIELNLAVQSMFKDHKDAPIWDVSALKEMNINRCELMVYYHNDFDPFFVLNKFSCDLVSLFNITAIRTQKPFF